MAGYLRPVDPTNGRISSYRAHTRRTTPSSEAGVDYYCPIGTEVRAGVEGRVFAIGGDVGPATGRFVTIDIRDGKRLRDLHYSRWLVKPGQIVEPDTIIGLSGASGYGSEFFGARTLEQIPANTGGPHVHRTLWPTQQYRFGRYPLEPTLDYELYVDRSASAGSGSRPFNPVTEEEDMITIWGNPQRGYIINGENIFLEVGGEIERLTGVPGPSIIAAFVAGGAREKAVDTATWDRIRVTMIASQPQTKTVQPIIDYDIIRETIANAFASVNIDADVSDADLTAIANRVIDVQAARLTLPRA